MVVPIMGTATFIRNLDDFTGDAALYRLTPAIATRSWGNEGETYEYVVVSATVVPLSGPETYIFGADETGNVLDWGELDGSFRGALDQDAALNGAGYQVVGD